MLFDEPGEDKLGRVEVYICEDVGHDVIDDMSESGKTV